MVQWDQQHLWKTRMQVHSLARHSGLRVWHCLSCGIVHNCGYEPCPGNSICHRAAKKEKKKKNILNNLNKVAKKKQI